jgi:hypothetical protein
MELDTLLSKSSRLFSSQSLQECCQIRGANACMTLGIHSRTLKIAFADAAVQAA